MMQGVQVFLTAFIAVIATMIAWRQYRTAYDRFVLDLFSKRIVVYGNFRDKIRSMAKHGATSSTVSSLQELENELAMLFGSDVYGIYISSLEMAHGGVVNRVLRDSQFVPDTPEDERRFKVISFSANSLYMRMPMVFSPYLEMHQKTSDPIGGLLRRISGWLHRSRS